MSIAIKNKYPTFAVDTFDYNTFYLFINIKIMYANDYLKNLASDEIDTYNIDQYTLFLETYITSFEKLIDVINALKSKIKTDNIDSHFFEPLMPYIQKYNPKVSHVIKTSHVFCENCDLYIPSLPCTWVKNNIVLFETEVLFFDLFISYFKLINDTPSYKVDELYADNHMPISGQTNKEKLKILNTIVKFYKYIDQHLID
jgi:hypothetical protein